MMDGSTQAPYGSWKSPITADRLLAKSVSLGAPWADGDDLYWLESRPTEGGRFVLARRRGGPGGCLEDVTPAPYSVRSRVHEYGGGAYVAGRGAVFFVNLSDQRLYRQDPSGRPRPLTGVEGDGAKTRYADMVLDQRRDLIVAVREDHAGPGHEDHAGPGQPVAALALVRSGDEGVLISGDDFYASPRLSPDGSRLAWLSWNHPNMPWDGTELWVADFDPSPLPAVGGPLTGRRRLAGGPQESIFQPEWGPDGRLYFVSDRTGWWNLYRLDPASPGVAPAPLCPMEAEFGLPQWVFGLRTYAIAPDGTVYCAYRAGGGWRLGRINPDTLEFTDLAVPYDDIGGPVVSGGRVYFRAGSAVQAPAIVGLDPSTGGLEVVRRSDEIPVDPAYLSVPEAIAFPTTGGREAHAFLYRPKNPDFSGLPGERPPVIVESHGGPTGAVSTVLNLGVQYWTSRGFAVVAVDYGGSTGYGRAYRERLRGNWGVVDVDDCCNVVGYLAARGVVDADRAVIRGGSAGGYTTLAALTFRDVFKAGVSLYGIGDLETLARDTHKFESRYLDGLIGPYPEAREIYRERSPIHYPERLSCPVIFFQGLEDRVVPPNQSEAMVNALREKGIPVAYLAFEGEGHGFLRAENIKKTIEGQLYFLSRVFGLTPADTLEPVVIENL